MHVDGGQGAEGAKDAAGHVAAGAGEVGSKVSEGVSGAAGHVADGAGQVGLPHAG